MPSWAAETVKVQSVVLAVATEVVLGLAIVREITKVQGVAGIYCYLPQLSWVVGAGA